MNTKANFFAELQNQFQQTFEAQDSELLDVTFVVEKQRLYADNLRLSLVSTTFKSMLSTRWTSKTDAIEIKDYKYENFKEMLSFIYSGECSLTDANAVVMLDMAEYYQLKHLKDLCDEYLAKMECNLGNVFEMMEMSNKYSMVQMKKSLQAFVAQNFDAFVNSAEFREASKDVIQELVGFESCDLSRENVFQAVYEWAEHQAKKKQEETTEENFVMNVTIKTILSDFLPYIQFKKMKQDFLIKYVVKRGFLFSYDELSDILDNANTGCTVKITNNRGQSLSGILPKGSNAVASIKSVEMRLSESGEMTSFVFWKPSVCSKCYNIPSTPSSLKRRNGVEWYLVYFASGQIGAERSCDVFRTHYVLAEMTAGTGGFEITPNCTIEIFD